MCSEAHKRPANHLKLLVKTKIFINLNWLVTMANSRRVTQGTKHHFFKDVIYM